MPGLAAMDAALRGAGGGVGNVLPMSIGRNVGQLLREALRVNMAGIGHDDTNAGAGEEGGSATHAGASSARTKPKKEYPKLRLAHFAACVDANVVDVERAFGLFDTNGDMAVSRDEFIHACEAVYMNMYVLLFGHVGTFLQRDVLGGCSRMVVVVFHFAYRHADA
jgi:hypothetical protein